MQSKLTLRSAAKKVLRRGFPVDRNIGSNIVNFRSSVPQELRESATRTSGAPQSIEIVVPCYNHAKYLRDAFESIKTQSFNGPLKVTFVNDASTDDSLDVIQTVISEEKQNSIQLKLLNNEINLKQGGSINRAVGESTSELIMILNADDLLTRDCIEVALATYEFHPEIFLLGGSSLWFEDGDQIPSHHPKALGELSLTIFGPQDVSNFKSLNSINMSQSSCSFFRSAWKTVGGYFPRERRVCSSDDRDFQMRVCSLFPIGIYEEYPMQFYRRNSSTRRGKL